MTFKGAMLSVKRMSKTEWDVFHRRYCPYQVFLEKKSPCEQMKGNCKECWSREIPDEKAVSPNGYKDGFAYNEGLKDAWELARKIVDEIGMHEREEIFGYKYETDVLNCITPQEALAKLKEYEEAQNKVEVGDVVESMGTKEKGVITRVKPNTVWVLYFDGSNSVNHIPTFNDNFKKTGKHIDIKAILEQIGE